MVPPVVVPAEEMPAEEMLVTTPSKVQSSMASAVISAFWPPECRECPAHRRPASSRGSSNRR